MLKTCKTFHSYWNQHTLPVPPSIIFLIYLKSHRYVRRNMDPDLMKTLSCLSIGPRADGFLQTLQYAGCPGSCIIYAGGINHLPHK